MKVLCIDIGSKTQDVLLYIHGEKIENCPKFVLPSPAVLIAKKIKRLTQRGKNIYLYGHNMGGGFKKELMNHLKKGLKVASHPEAAMAIKDNLSTVESYGIKISLSCPKDYIPLYLTDFDPLFWESVLNQFGLDLYDMVIIAAQDHGFHGHISNREGRFKIWKELLTIKIRIEELLFEKPPSSLTRLRTINSITHGPVADTSSAAALGVLYDKQIEDLNYQQGICIVNVGNSHTTAFLLYKNEIHGLYEQHTSNLTKESLVNDLEKLCQKRLTHEEVFSKNGHGCFIKESDIKFSTTRLFAIGPRRDMLDGIAQFIHPGGDVMLAGCFGLIKAASYKKII